MAFDADGKMELMFLAKSLRQQAEPGYQEEQTRLIWTNFAKDHSFSFHTMLEGKAPVITLGDYEHARHRILFTADLDAVWNPVAKTWMHLCGHHAQSVHAFALALLYQQGFFSTTIAIRLMGCPAEECYPAFFPQDASRFIPGKRILYELGAFSRATCVLSTHLADQVSSRAVILARGAYGLIWLRVKHRAPDEGLLHTDEIAHIKAFLQSCFVDMTVVAHDVRIRTQISDNSSGPGSGDELISLLHKMGVDTFLVTEYPPLLQDVNLLKKARGLLREQYPDVICLNSLSLQGSTDFGVASCETPTFQLFVGGTQNMTHDPSFSIVDEEFAYLFAGVFIAHLIKFMTHESQ